MLRSRVTLASALAVVLVTAACGGSSPSAPTGPEAAPPSTPAPAPPPASSSGASIRGLVVSASESASAVMPLGLAGVTVSVVGSDLSVVADGSGRFSLASVPAGDVQLRFSGAGANATLGLGTVAEREQIDITVSVSGSSASVERQERVNGSESQLEGRIDAVNAGARSFTIGDVTVVVPAGVPITNGFRDLAFTDLVAGARVHARGTRAGSTLTATWIQAQQTGLETTEVTGVLTDLAGACPDRTFRIGSRAIAVNGSTIFVRTSCAELTDRSTVEIRALRRPDGTLLATMVRLEDRPGDDDEEAEVRGRVSGLSGSCPDLRFTVAGKTIVTNGSTEFLRGACTSLSSTSIVQVEGTADGSTITARKVQFEDDQGNDEDEVELRGVVSGRSGACPSIAFTVQGTRFETSAATEFRRSSCGDVADGRTVEAKGDRRGDGAVTATRVQVE